jgi:uncharacterized protein YndB with AHSA1/START domain
MTGFELVATCRAPAVEVFKLLHDPDRFPDWWAGMDRLEAGEDGLTRYMSEWPDFAYPTSISRSPEDGSVTISCLLSDIVHEWRLEPRSPGCAVRVRVELPDSEAHRIDAQREEVGGSLVGLVALAEAEAQRGPARP